MPNLQKHMITIPVSLTLISLAWWQNFVHADSVFPPIRSMAKSVFISILFALFIMKAYYTWLQTIIIPPHFQFSILLFCEVMMKLHVLSMLRNICVSV